MAQHRSLSPAIDARYRRRTRLGAGVLLAATLLLTGLAVWLGLAFAGVLALLTTFLGGAWLAIRWLRERWARAMGPAIHDEPPG
jgi:hypothetical protein